VKRPSRTATSIPRQRSRASQRGAPRQPRCSGLAETTSDQPGSLTDLEEGLRAAIRRGGTQDPRTDRPRPGRGTFERALSMRGRYARTAVGRGVVAAYGSLAVRMPTHSERDVGEASPHDPPSPERAVAHRDAPAERDGAARLRRSPRIAQAGLEVPRPGRGRSVRAPGCPRADRRPRRPSSRSVQAAGLVPLGRFREPLPSCSPRRPRWLRPGTLPRNRGRGPRRTLHLGRGSGPSRTPRERSPTARRAGRIALACGTRTRATFR